MPIRLTIFLADRRMEHRIGAIKRQISNLGSNIDQDHVQLVNQTIEIKEKLYHATRKSHGVKIRSGRHVPRSDTQDYERLMNCLDETEAHVRKPGRCFGNYNFPRDLTTDTRFGKAAFIRWLTKKNKEAKSIFEASQ